VASAAVVSAVTCWVLSAAIWSVVRAATWAVRSDWMTEVFRRRCRPFRSPRSRGAQGRYLGGAQRADLVRGQRHDLVGGQARARSAVLSEALARCSVRIWSVVGAHLLGAQRRDRRGFERADVGGFNRGASRCCSCPPPGCWSGRRSAGCSGRRPGRWSGP
jgi:hypothetical protein